MTALRAHFVAELRLMSRQGEQLLVSIGIPLGVLVFFSLVDTGTFGNGRAVDYLTPASMALAVISTSMVSLGIGTSFEREYGVLKRLGSTPLGRGRWLLAKLLVIAVMEVTQLILLAAVGLALGWKPNTGFGQALLAALLGTCAFAGLGMFLAGRLRATTNLAVTNGTYLALLITGGTIVPFDKMPSALRTVTSVLPAAPLAGLMVDGLGPDQEMSVAAMRAVLAFWAVLLPMLAIRTFRWEPNA